MAHNGLYQVLLSQKFFLRRVAKHDSLIFVWQHGAEKTSEKARLDITHYEPLTDNDVEKIEQRANEIVRKNLPVTTLGKTPLS